LSIEISKLKEETSATRRPLLRFKNATRRQQSEMTRVLRLEGIGTMVAVSFQVPVRALATGSSTR
jgi:hypothetical protein